MKFLFKLPLLIAILNFFLYFNMYIYGMLKDGYIKEVTHFIYQMTPIKYMLCSGIVSAFAIILAIILILNKKISVNLFATSVILNLLYLGAFIYWFGRQ